MCGNTSCALAKTDRIKLRELCVELAGPSGPDLRNLRLDAGHLIFDVCSALAIEPVVVMDAKTVYAIRAEGADRLWPTLTEAEDEEMIELAGIREPEIKDEEVPVSPSGIEGMYSPRWRITGIRNT